MKFTVEIDTSSSRFRSASSSSLVDGEVLADELRSVASRIDGQQMAAGENGVIVPSGGIPIGSWKLQD